MSDDLFGARKPLAGRERTLSRTDVRIGKAAYQASIQPAEPDPREREFWRVLEAQVSRWNWRVWFAGARLERGKLVAADATCQDWIGRHYADQIQHASERSGLSVTLQK
jgi:hypothetical protein